MIPSWLDVREPTELDLLVAFTDLTRFADTSRRLGDLAVAAWLERTYATVHRHVEPAGGHVLKYIGDSTLCVFPEDRVDDGVRALLALKRALDAQLGDEGMGSEVVIKAHFGRAVVGRFGPARQLDCLGGTVNATALLRTRALAISPQLFRKLAPTTRKAFKKHTPPVTYIRTEDTHSRE